MDEGGFALRAGAGPALLRDKLCVRSRFRDDPDLRAKMDVCLAGVWKLVTFSEGRFLTLGISTQALIAT